MLLLIKLLSTNYGPNKTGKWLITNKIKLEKDQEMFMFEQVNLINKLGKIELHKGKIDSHIGEAPYAISYRYTVYR